MFYLTVAPVWGRGLKCNGIVMDVSGQGVAPVWGRGLKYMEELAGEGIDAGRPRMGAWIEIVAEVRELSQEGVAPVWGRGLKSLQKGPSCQPAAVAPVWGRGLK